MCGRFTSLTPPEELAEIFEARLADESGSDAFQPNYNVAPTTSVHAVALSPSRGRVLGRLRWGLIPEWSREAKGTGQINARSETVAEKPTFRDSFRRRRCLVPMSGYYEWRTIGGHESLPTTSTRKAEKRAVYVTRADGLPLAVAGLWASWSDRSSRSSDSAVRTCCVLTTRARGALASVHDRMPVILDRDAWSLWLGEESTESTEQLLALLEAPQRVDHLSIIDVGPLVNSNRNNGPELIASIR